MSDRYRIRRAVEPDIAEIMAILEGRREWLRAMSSDQWSSVSEWRHLMIYLVRHGNVWVMVDGEDYVVGTMTLGTDPDVDFWDDDERRTPAIYVSKLATDVGHRGQELGARLLDWALEMGARKRISVVRLDTWKTSPDLQQYYLRRGWRYVRTAHTDGRRSGALFERATPRRLLRETASERLSGQSHVAEMSP